MAQHAVWQEIAVSTTARGSDDRPNNFGDTRGGALAGPLALFIMVVLGIATVLLIRHMNGRLRRLPDRFDTQPSPSPEPSQKDTHPREV